jgi:hypothetical protein
MHPFVVSSVSVEFVPLLKRSIRASIPALEVKSETASVALNVPLIAPVRARTVIFRAARYYTTSSLKSALPKEVFRRTSTRTTPFADSR